MKRSLLILALVVLAAVRARAATFLVADDRTLVQACRAIVVATAGESVARRAPGGWLETVTTMHVDECIKGDVGDTIAVTELGGVVDGIGYIVAGSPRYARGERVLLFLETNARGEFVAKNMAVGKFTFSGPYLVRDAAEVIGWDLDGTPHRERTRAAEPFLAFVRRTAHGETVAANYFVSDPPPLATNAVRAAANPSIASYLLQSSGSSGTLGIRWNVFPGGVSFLSHGTQPGALNGGLTALQRAFSAWSSAPGANVVYAYAGTTAIASTGFKSGNNDGVNTVQFNDPADEIPGAFTGKSGDTLAIGGGWFSTSGANATHTFAAETFYTLQEADLVVQNGITGAGLSGNGFDHVITHELGHTLGLRHSDDPPAGGTSTTNAVMNSSVAFNSDTIGATLQQWDIDAIRAVYPGTVTCIAPQITTQPKSVSLGTADVTLAVAASGASLQYQWYTGARGNTSSPVNGATTPSITVHPAATTSYWVRVANGCDPPADSEVAVVTVNNCPAVFLTSLSPNVTIIQGSVAHLAVAATGGTLRYQWFAGATGTTTNPIANATNATLDVAPATSTNYWVRVANDCGATIASDTVSVVVTPCDKPRVLASPSGGTVVTGGDATFYAAHAGTEPLHYQWFTGNAGDASSPVPGGTSETLVVHGVTSPTAYWVRMTNDCGSADSAAAHVTLVASCTAPAIVRQPQDATVLPGGTTTLAVDATGPSLVYQWYAGQLFDFTHPVGGSNAALVVAAQGTSAQFWVRITGACGVVNSSVATVTLAAPPRRRSAGH